MLNKILESWWGKLIASAAGFYVAYYLVIRAIDSGSILQYSVAAVLAIYGINRLAASVKTLFKR